MVALVLAAIELGSFLALRFVIIPRDPSFVYVVPDIDHGGFEHYRARRHPILGWVPRSQGGSTEIAESRPVPSFSGNSRACVSLYGDSFTFSDEVTDEEAWSNYLSEQLGCKAANFGVGGYGMDQAYLRFELNEADDAPLSILGITPYDLLRNLNQYQLFLAGPRGSVFGLKPR